ncbi:MAG: N-acetylmuramic acid 6-phosphate etherase, partial [Elusimicrobia bacterium]|nr:N-acetylmuramic acid 6-phosphate etherase [Elusimicrobiota bacterium]
LRAASRRGCFTVFVTCNPKPPDFSPDALVVLDTGPEALAGSTRLKAGSATKMALNSITTAAMVKCGKVYGNRMVDLKPWSAKLKARAARLVSELGGVDEDRAEALLRRAGWEVKTAVVMARRELDARKARALLARKGGMLRGALE